MTHMKKRIIGILAFIILISKMYSLDVNTFCKHYFNEDSYTLCEIDYEDTLVYVAYSTFETFFTRRIVAFYHEEQKIIPILYVDGYLIENNESIIANNPMPNNSFYAWKLKISNGILYLTPYSNNGKNVTDPIKLKRNPETQTYEIRRIDSSMY